MVINDMVFNNMVSHDAHSFYKGSLPIDIKEFPMVQDIIEKGKESNIHTGIIGVGDINDPDDNRVMLYPQLRQGVPITDFYGVETIEEAIDIMIKKGENFGIYDNKDQADWVDQYIHEEFQKQQDGR